MMLLLLLFFCIQKGGGFFSVWVLRGQRSPGGGEAKRSQAESSAPSREMSRRRRRTRTRRVGELCRHVAQSEGGNQRENRDLKYDSHLKNTQSLFTI